MPGYVVWSVKIASQGPKIIAPSCVFTVISLSRVWLATSPLGFEIDIMSVQSDCYFKPLWAVDCYYRPSWEIDCYFRPSRVVDCYFGPLLASALMDSITNLTARIQQQRDIPSTRLNSFAVAPCNHPHATREKIHCRAPLSWRNYNTIHLIKVLFFSYYCQFYCAIDGSPRRAAKHRTGCAYYAYAQYYLHVGRHWIHVFAANFSVLDHVTNRGHDCKKGPKIKPNIVRNQKQSLEEQRDAVKLASTQWTQSRPVGENVNKLSHSRRQLTKKSLNYWTVESCRLSRHLTIALSKCNDHVKLLTWPRQVPYTLSNTGMSLNYRRIS